MSVPLVLSECELDFKYEEVVSRLDIEYRYAKYYHIILWLLGLGGIRARRATYLHFRYLKWRGPVRTLPIYLAMLGLARLQGVTIVWTCHNVWEYSMPSRRQNAFLRWLMTRAAHRIVVLHRSVGDHLGDAAAKKLVVAHFGSFRQTIERASQEAKPNPEFTASYERWRQERGVRAPDLVMVSTLWEADDLLAFLGENPDVNGVIIAPRMGRTACGENVLLFRKPVYAEVHELLGSTGLIGYLGHANVSVPTSLYMFAGYGIPMIGMNVPPVADILAAEGVGEVYTTIDEMGAAYRKIKAHYQAYRSRCAELVARHTWSHSATVHKKIFR